MASYKRLVKVKARAAKWKARAKAYERDALLLSEELSEYKNHAEESILRLRNQGAEIKRLKALIIEKDERPGLPKKSDEIRIQELEQENSKLRHELEEKLQDIGEMGKSIASQTGRLYRQTGPNAFKPAEINVIGREK